MASRGSRDAPNTSAPYHDDADEHLSSNGHLNGDQEDALSFLRIEEGEPGYIEEEDRNSIMTWPIKHPILRQLPPQMRQTWRAVVHWCKGPQPPRPWKIKPLFERAQTAHLRLLDWYFPTKVHKAGLLAGFYLAWLLTFSLVLRKSAFASDVGIYGPPVNIGCRARFWSVGRGCGLNGDRCRPFENTTFTFRCPASCSRALILEPYPVGDQEVNYTPLVVGGPMGEEGAVSGAAYRGDSFICPSAIHSGYLNDREGGCGVAKLVGEKQDYPSVKRHKIKSIGFDSYFPLSYSFIKGTASTCKDLRWSLLAVSVTYSAVLSLFTTSPKIFFCSIFTGLFVHVALVSDPPGNSDYHALVSTMIGRFLPSAFCAVVFYIIAVRHTLRDLTAQVEKTILWLGACWVGSLNNYTFDKIPIQRLTPHDIHQQPGAVPALIGIVLALFGIALGQAWCFRIEGLMPRYLGIYGLLGGGLLFLLAVPDLKIRIHHYILAMLLLPGTRLQTRPSLLYQGLLIGFFINGIARWGYDPILQTPLELRGDAPLGTRLPIIPPPIIYPNIDLGIPANITFRWEFPDTAEVGEESAMQYDGISVLVNEVERFKTYRDQDVDEFTWTRMRDGVPEYFRFAYMMGGSAGDYTKAGTWEVDGGWVPMKDGAS